MLSDDERIACRMLVEQGSQFGSARFLGAAALRLDAELAALRDADDTKAITVFSENNRLQAELAALRSQVNAKYWEGVKSDNAQYLERIRSLQAELAAAKGELGAIAEVLESAPELNPVNYDHEQVCHLNGKMTEATLIARAALSASDVPQKGDVENE